MNEQLRSFVDSAQSKGMSSNDITELLVEEGWSRAEIARALYGELEVPRPLHPINNNHATVTLENRSSNDPISVVNNLSTRGFEYSIMFVSLWASAVSLGIVLHQFVNNIFYTQPIRSGYYDDYSSSYDSGSEYAFPLIVILVTLPIFVSLFLRLKRAELTDPSLRRDASRKRLSHLTQIVSFVIGVGYFIFFLNSLVSGDLGKDGAESFGELFFQVLITLLIAGGIFAYYWIDEHRAEKT